MALEAKLIELRVVKGAKARNQSAKSPNEPELRGDDVCDEAEPRFFGKLEAILGFPLHILEWISSGEKARYGLE